MQDPRCAEPRSSSFLPCWPFFGIHVAHEEISEVQVFNKELPSGLCERRTADTFFLVNRMR